MRRTVLTVLAVSACLASVASAATVNKTFNQTVNVNLRATPSGCENNPGPWITIDGELKLSGVNVQILLSNNTKGTHTASTNVLADVVLIPAGETIKVAKQPSRGGVGGNPWIYFQFSNGQGELLGPPVRLGRCVQGLTNVSGAFPLPTGASTNVHADGCTNSGGPFITLDGELRLGGLNGKIILTNNAKFTHATAEDVVIDVVLLPEGETRTFAKQPPLGGAGGNPLLYILFTSGSGDAIGTPILLGRCNQL